MLEKQGSAAAKSELVFPTEEFLAGCDLGADPPAEDAEEIEKSFQDLITGA